MNTIKGNAKVVLLIIAALIIVFGSYFFIGNKKSGLERLPDQLVADFDSDGTDDLAYFAAEKTSTTTLYHLAVSLDTSEGKKDLEPRLIGNQIIPVNIEFKDGHILVNYIDRKPDEPVTAEARFAYTKTFAVRDGKLVRAFVIE